jgi:uncharacterized SAM-binding protein YcdF (DUF218 family)
MDIAFFLKKLVTATILPPLGPLLLLAGGLLLSRRSPRLSKALAWSGVAVALALSLPLTVGWLLEPLEQAPVLDPARTAEAQAIVILAGGKRRYAPEFGGETVSAMTLERLRYGARLARRTGLPVMVSGGAPTEGESEAQLMRSALAEDFGVQTRWAEPASLDTHENAVFAARILKEAGVQRVILVSHALHLPRAQAAFEEAGIRVVPAPTAFLRRAQFDGSPLVRTLANIPVASSAFVGAAAAHEWLGRLAQEMGIGP